MIDDNSRYRMNQNKLLVGLLDSSEWQIFPNHNLHRKVEKVILDEVQVKSSHTWESMVFWKKKSQHTYGLIRPFLLWFDLKFLICKSFLGREESPESLSSSRSKFLSSYRLISLLPLPVCLQIKSSPPTNLISGKSSPSENLLTTTKSPGSSITNVADIFVRLIFSSHFYWSRSSPRINPCLLLVSSLYFWLLICSPLDLIIL